MATSRVGRGRGATAVFAGRRLLGWRWIGHDDRGLFLLVLAATVAGAVLMYAYPAVVTASVLLVPLVLSNVLLSPQRIPQLAAVIIAVLTVGTVLEFEDGIPARRWVNIVITATMAGVLVLVARRRQRLGVATLLGDAMLIDLQDRISRHSRVPQLPPGWYVDLATRSAGGTSFAGDFMVAHRRGDEQLSIALVDVSGKGVDAGTRSLLLSGAFGGLLGALPPGEFLPAANDFLLRQGWEEGFATAIHLALDLRDGSFDLRSAGHPPAIQFLAGSGRWQAHSRVDNPVLGLIPGADYPPTRGRLGHGDMLMLYTDGMVERPRRDIGLGIDRLVGEAERLVPRGFAGCARGLVDRLGARDDDCALVVLQRSG